MWFDIEPARRELGWEPRYSAAEMFAESYDWFLAHRHVTSGASEHRRPVRQGVLALLKRGAGAKG
jgi:hypothetical protein